MLGEIMDIMGYDMTKKMGNVWVYGCILALGILSSKMVSWNSSTGMGITMITMVDQDAPIYGHLRGKWGFKPWMKWSTLISGKPCKTQGTTLFGNDQLTLVVHKLAPDPVKHEREWQRVSGARSVPVGGA